MKNSLSPQIRIDKNGRAVTRHVKESSIGDVSRSFPAPAAPSLNDPRADYIQRLNQVLINISTSAGTDYFSEEILCAKDDSLLKILEDASSNLRPEDRSYRKALRDIVKMSEPGAVEKHLRAATVLRGAIWPGLMLRFIAGMDKTETLRPYAERLNEAPEAVKEKARLLATAVEKIKNVDGAGASSGKRFYINDPALESAILNNPDRMDEFIAFVAERGSGAALSEIDSAHGAVRAGIL